MEGGGWLGLGDCSISSYIMLSDEPAGDNCLGEVGRDFESLKLDTVLSQ